MGMTKRDYLAISAAILALWDFEGADHATVQEAAIILSECLANNNPMFDKLRFLRACGVL